MASSSLLNRIAVARHSLIRSGQRIDSLKATSAARVSALPFSGNLRLFAAPSHGWRWDLPASKCRSRRSSNSGRPCSRRGCARGCCQHLRQWRDRARRRRHQRAACRRCRAGGPPVPDDGTRHRDRRPTARRSRPVDGLPPIRDADFVTRIHGRVATIALGRGTVDLAPGRKLTVTDGALRSSRHQCRQSRRRARGCASTVRCRPRRNCWRPTGCRISRARRSIRRNSRGTVTAQVGLAFALDPDAPRARRPTPSRPMSRTSRSTSFVMSHKVEAQTLRITANNQGYQVKGDVRIAGTPASIEYRKHARRGRRAVPPAGHARRCRAHPPWRSISTARLSDPSLCASAGRVRPTATRKTGSRSMPILSQARIDNLLPGWSKPAGKPMRATFNYIGKPKSTRLEDIVIEGPGTSVKGTVEIDPNGDLLSANLAGLRLVRRRQGLAASGPRAPTACCASSCAAKSSTAAAS